MQVADALSQEIRIKSGVPQGSVIGSLLFMLLVNGLPSVINVTSLLFADDVKMVSPCSQSDFLLSSIYNIWNWSINLDLSLFFIPPVRPGLRDHQFKVLQGPSRRLRRKSSLSTRVTKCWIRLPTPILTTPSVNSFKCQLFAEVPSFYSLPSRSPITQSHLTLSPLMLSQPLIHCYL